MASQPSVIRTMYGFVVEVGYIAPYDRYESGELWRLLKSDLSTASVDHLDVDHTCETVPYFGPSSLPPPSVFEACCMSGASGNGDQPMYSEHIKWKSLRAQPLLVLQPDVTGTHRYWHANYPQPPRWIIDILRQIHAKAPVMTSIRHALFEDPLDAVSFIAWASSATLRNVIGDDYYYPGRVHICRSHLYAFPCTGNVDKENEQPKIDKTEVALLDNNVIDFVCPQLMWALAFRHVNQFNSRSNACRLQTNYVRDILKCYELSKYDHITSTTTATAIFFMAEPPELQARVLNLSEVKTAPDHPDVYAAYKSLMNLYSAIDASSSTPSSEEVKQLGTAITDMPTSKCPFATALAIGLATDLKWSESASAVSNAMDTLVSFEYRELVQLTSDLRGPMPTFSLALVEDSTPVAVATISELGWAFVLSVFALNDSWLARKTDGDAQQMRVLRQHVTNVFGRWLSRISPVYVVSDRCAASSSISVKALESISPDILSSRADLPLVTTSGAMSAPVAIKRTTPRFALSRQPCTALRYATNTVACSRDAGCHGDTPLKLWQGYWNAGRVFPFATNTLFDSMPDDYLGSDGRFCSRLCAVHGSAGQRGVLTLQASKNDLQLLSSQMIPIDMSCRTPSDVLASGNKRTERSSNAIYDPFCLHTYGSIIVAPSLVRRDLASSLASDASSSAEQANNEQTVDAGTNAGGVVLQSLLGMANRMNEYPDVLNMLYSPSERKTIYVHKYVQCRRACPVVKTRIAFPPLKNAVLPLWITGATLHSMYTEEMTLRMQGDSIPLGYMTECASAVCDLILANSQIQNYSEIAVMCDCANIAIAPDDICRTNNNRSRVAIWDGITVAFALGSCNEIMQCIATFKPLSLGYWTYDLITTNSLDPTQILEALCRGCMHGLSQMIDEHLQTTFDPAATTKLLLQRALHAGDHVSANTVPNAMDMSQRSAQDDLFATVRLADVGLPVVPHGPLTFACLIIGERRAKWPTELKKLALNLVVYSMAYYDAARCALLKTASLNQRCRSGDGDCEHKQCDSGRRGRHASCDNCTVELFNTISRDVTSMFLEDFLTTSASSFRALFSVFLPSSMSKCIDESIRSVVPRFRAGLERVSVDAHTESARLRDDAAASAIGGDDILHMQDQEATCLRCNATMQLSCLATTNAWKTSVTANFLRVFDEKMSTCPYS